MEQRNLTDGRLLNLPDLVRQFQRRYREWKRGRELYTVVYPRISLQNILKHAYNGITRDRIFPS